MMKKGDSVELLSYREGKEQGVATQMLANKANIGNKAWQGR